MLVAQVSDLHFGTEVPPVLAALEQWLHAQRPSLVILSGDITQRATPGQFDLGRAFAGRCPCPVLAIPGNHDIPLYNLAARALAPYARYRSAFGEDLEPVHDTPACLVIGVNTTRRWRHTDGEISAAQIARVSQRLRGAPPGQVRMVAVHQPVFVTRAEDEKNLLHGHAQAVREWSAAGADIILGGHIHLPYVAPLHEQPRFGSLPRRIWTVQAGTAVSSRVRRGAPNSVNLLRINEGEAGSAPACRVERWDCGGEQTVFRCKAVHELPLHRP